MGPAVVHVQEQRYCRQASAAKQYRIQVREKRGQLTQLEKIPGNLEKKLLCNDAR
jgi:hypothetical protein